MTRRTFIFIPSLAVIPIPKWTEQMMVDALNLRRHPYDRTYVTCQMGHRNCAFYGLCSIVELRNILGSDSEIVRYIENTKPWDCLSKKEKRIYMRDSYMNEDIPML